MFAHLIVASLALSYETRFLGVRARVSIINDSTCAIDLEGWPIRPITGLAQWDPASGHVSFHDADFISFLNMQGVRIDRVRRWHDDSSDEVVVDIGLPFWGRRKLVMHRTND